MHFTPPKKIMCEIERIYTTFLWKGRSNSARATRVTWANVCLLGMWTDLFSWNKAYIHKKNFDYY